MDEIREQAWTETLLIWKWLSKTKSQDVPYLEPDEFKNEVLKSLDLEPKKFGCPFCQAYFESANCPLGTCVSLNASCYKYRYAQWERTLSDLGIHCQFQARSFYYQLILVLFTVENHD